jgi:hypothetical protein
MACRNTAELVANTVRLVIKKLGRPAMDEAEWPVDLEDRVEGLRANLQEPARTATAIIGLHGMRGIGKTTLATAVYNALRFDFIDNCCFVEVGNDGTDLKRLQKHLLKVLCGVDREVQHVSEGIAELRQRLAERRVLLVIDNIWTEVQWKALLPSVGKGSILMLTGRDEEVLRGVGGLALQHVELLSQAAALELFSKHAFGTFLLPAGPLGGLADGIVEACVGLPLSLKVMGAHLRGKQDKLWRQALGRLKKGMSLGGGKANDQLWASLKLSYDDLEEDEKSAFLDSACFLLDRQATVCALVWGELGTSILDNLKSKALVGEDEDDILTVHDQLRDMGPEIVMDGVGQRSRVWDNDGFQKVLKCSKVGYLQLSAPCSLLV